MSMEQGANCETGCSTNGLAAQIEQRRIGGRERVLHRGTLCSRCLSAPPASAKVRYCRPCHTAYEREWRKRKVASHPSTDANELRDAINRRLPPGEKVA